MLTLALPSSSTKRTTRKQSHSYRVTSSSRWLIGSPRALAPERHASQPIPRPDPFVTGRPAQCHQAFPCNDAAERRAMASPGAARRPMAPAEWCEFVDGAQVLQPGEVVTFV